MHDGPFLGLQGVHRAQVVSIGPDGRAQVLIPEVMGETPLFAQSLVPIPADLDTCGELMANRDSLFPPEPEF